MSIEVYVKAVRASDNINDQTDGDGAGAGLLRFYPNLDGDDTIAKLRVEARKFFYTKAESYIFQDTNGTEIKDDETLIKDIAKIEDIESKDDEKKSDSNTSTRIIVNAKKEYKQEKPGETDEAANALIDEVVELDNKAFYANASIRGCSIVLQNILDLLDGIFKDIENDPLLQTVVAVAKQHDKVVDDTEEKVKNNQKEFRKILAALGAYKPNWVDQLNKILGLTLMGCTVFEGLKWGTKKAAKRIKNDSKMYDASGAETKYGRRYNRAKKWGSRFAKGMKGLSVMAGVASIGLTIYGLVKEAEMKKDHWRKVCQQLIDQKQKRYDDYEDIYSRYNDLTDSMWILRNQFVKNFQQQCTDKLANMAKPSIDAIKDSDTALQELIEECSKTLTSIYKYLQGLVKEFTEVSTYLDTMREFTGDDLVKTVKGYERFIAQKEKKLKEPVKQKKKDRYEDLYTIYLIDQFYKVITKENIDKILPYDQELGKIVDTFPRNDDGKFGEKNVKLPKYIQQVRMTYLWFHGVYQNADSTDTSNKAVVTLEFTSKVQELYDKENEK